MTQDILLITDDSQMLAKFRHLQAQFNLDLRTANTLGEGLKEIFFRHPAIVFLQKNIGGIPSERIGAQVRRLLDNVPVRLVLLVEDPTVSIARGEAFDGSMYIGSALKDIALTIKSYM